MKKLLFLLLALFLWTSTIWGQDAGSYTGVTSTDATLVDMTTDVTVLLTGYADDAASSVTAIGFTFNYCATDYTQFSINSNGQMQLGATVISGGAASPAANVARILPLSGDNAIMATYTAGYKVIGTSPNRILVVEWGGFRVNYGSTGGTAGTMQCLLYENGGKIEFVYGVMWNSSTSAQTRGVAISNGNTAGKIGQWTTINTTPTYNTSATSITGTSFAASSAMTNLNGTVPGSLRKFTFTPPIIVTPPNCAVNVSPIDLATDILNTTTLNWSNGGGGPTGYDLYFGTDNPPTNINNGTDLGLVTTYNPTPDLNYSTTYYWKIVPYNTNGDATGCPVWSFTTGPDPTITAFPHTESFDVTWVGNPVAPYGWLNIKTAGTGTPGTWDRQTAGTNPTCVPQSGVGMARYNCYSLSAGTIGELITPPINFPTDNYRVSFWMYRDNGYLTNADLLNVYYNTTNNSTGATLLGTINRSINLEPIVALTGWNQYNFNLPTGSTGNGRYLIFEAVSAFGNNIFLDEIVLEEIQALPPNAASLVFPLDGLTTFNNPLISWTPSLTGEPPTGYRVYLDATSSPSTLVYDGPNTTFQTAGLNAGEIYFWKVVPYNATGDATGIITWSFSTVATGYLAESFELATFPPVGWANTGTWSRSTTTPFHGTAGAYKSTTTANTDYLLRTPLLTMTPTSSLQFFARTTTADADQRIQIQYSPDGTTWTDIGTEIILQTNTWIHYNVDLSSLTGANYYLAFAKYHTTTSGNVYIDHVIGPLLALVVPDAVALVSPADLATNVSATPSLSWTAASTGGVPTGYKIYLDQNASPTTLIANVASSPYLVTPLLNYSTTYFWKVVAYNGSGDGPASVIRSFTTLADPTLTPPIIEPFATYPPLNWTETTGLLANPSVLTGTTSTWLSDNFANAIGGSISARVNIYGTSIDEWMITPPINLGDGSINYNLIFDLALTLYADTGPAETDGIDDKFAVVISTDNGVTWSSANILRLWDNAESAYIYNNISNTSETVTIDLSAYSGIVKIGFYGESTVSNADNDLFVDNFSVQEATACLSPSALTATSITTTSATLGWTENGTATLWDLEVVTYGTTPTGTPTHSNVTNPYTVTGLTHSTAYQFYVRADCGGDNSTWIGPYAFSTLCAPHSIIIEGFETIFPPTCWSLYNNGLGNNWQHSVIPYSGDFSMEYSWNTANAADAWAFTPAFSMIAGKVYVISFFQAIASSAYPEKLKVTVGTDATVASQTTILWDNAGGENLLNEEWLERIIEYTPTTTGVYYFAFNCYSDADMYDLFIDDVRISEKPQIDLALTDFYQTAASRNMEDGALHDFNVTRTKSTDYVSLPNNPDNGQQSSQDNYTVLLPNENVSARFPVIPVGLQALISNHGVQASSFTLNWLVGGVNQTPYNGPSIASDGTHLADLTYMPTARGTFITSATVVAAGDAVPSNDSKSFRMRVYPDVFTRTVYDRGDNIVDTYVGWNDPTTAMKAGVRYTATEDTKLAGVDFIYRTEAVTTGTITVQIRAAGLTTGAPGAVLYTRDFNTADYLPTGDAGDYISFPFEDTAPVIAAGSDYWITIQSPIGVLYPGAVHNTGITLGRSFYEDPDDPTIWYPLIITTERAWIMRAINTIPVTTKTLTVTALLEGLANGSGGMNQANDEFGPHFGTSVADQVQIELRNSTTGALEYTTGLINISTSGLITATIPSTYSGSYYLYIKHRNSITTSSATPVSFAGASISYNFTGAANMAYGDNMKLMSGVYYIFAGDVDQSLDIGVLDMALIDNQAAAFGVGYLPEDIDGDGSIGVLDMGIVDNNSAAFVSAYLPF